jgi:hypothetical protein
MVVPMVFAKEPGTIKDYFTNEVGMEVEKTEKIFGETSWAKAKHEYRFRFPNGNPFSMRVWVDKALSRFPNSRLGLSKVVVNGDGSLSTMIYVESNEKTHMTPYTIVFKFAVHEKHCKKIKLPAGYQMVRQGTRCVFQRIDCAKFCGSKKVTKWTKKGCICSDAPNTAAGSRG